MRETLYLILPVDDTGIAVPYRIDGEFPGRTATAPIAEVLAQAAGRRVVAFAPGEVVRLEQVDLPIRQAARLRKAIPYALEDQLAEDIDELHFAIGQRQRGGHAVAIVSHRQMAQWQSLCESHGARLDALIPEPLALPCTDGEWTLLAMPGRVVLRSGPAAGFACPDSMLETYLGLSPPPPDTRLRVHLVDGASSELPGLPQEVELVPGYGNGLDLLIETISDGVPLNLLQGPYSQRESLRRYWAPWRLPAAMAGALLFTALVVTAFETRQLEQEAAALETANVQRWLQLYPGETRISDLRLQLQQKLQAAGVGTERGGFLRLLAVVAETLPAAPGLSLRGMQFQNGELFLNLSGDELQSLERLRAAFAERSDARLEVQSANAGSEGVQIRVKVSAA